MYRFAKLTSSHRITAAIVAAVLILAGSAFAQESDSDLRRQNQQLSNEVSELQRRLDAAEGRNRDLEQRITQLEQLLSAARRGSTTTSTLPPLEPEEVTVDESIPNASPRALFKELIANYENTMREIDIGDNDDRVRRAYLKQLDSWRSRVNREYRSPIEWHVRAIDARVGPNRERIVTFIAVDPKTDVQLGDAFDAVLSQSLVDRLANFEIRGELGMLVMRGTLIPEVRINPFRIDRGTFDIPPFVGPFAEFFFRVDATSLKLLRDDGVEDTTSNQPPVPPAPSGPPRPAPVSPNSPPMK
jgi:hypothetical protein